MVVLAAIVNLTFIGQQRFAMDFENTRAHTYYTKSNFKKIVAKCKIVLNSLPASTKLRIITLLYKPIDFSRL